MLQTAKSVYFTLLLYVSMGWLSFLPFNHQHQSIKENNKAPALTSGHTSSFLHLEMDS